MKRRDGMSQRREEKRREKKNQKRESLRRKKIRVREKVGKSPVTAFLFQWFVAPEGRKVGSLKRRVRSKLARWEMNIARRCGAKHIWKSNVESTSRSDRFWKLRWWTGARRCGAKHICNQNAQNTAASEHFWKLRCSTSVHCCGAKHISKSKCTKHHMFAPLLDVEASFSVPNTRDSPPCRKWAKCEGFVAVPKAMVGVGNLKRICKDAFRVAGAIQERYSSEMLKGQGADFLRGVAFWSIRSSVLGKWFCVTGATLPMTWHQFFVAGAKL